MENARFYRHGDVGLKQIAALPKGAKRTESKIIAEGELTGHHHALTGGEATIYELGGIYYVQVLSEAILDHPEHGPMPLLPGTYQYKPQREWDPYETAIMRVSD